MTNKERKNLVSDIKNGLDALPFSLDYVTKDYHSQGTTIVDVNIDISNSEDWDDNWDEQVEDVIADVVSNWGGWYSWSGWCISVSIPD